MVSEPARVGPSPLVSPLPDRGEPAATASPCPGPVGDERITVMGLLMETHGRLTRVLGAELEELSGIPLGWYDVLIRIGRSAEGRLTMTQLGAEVLLTSGGITRLVDRMAEAGYVERQNCPSDRRSVYVALTTAGRVKLEEATAVHLDGLQRHLVDPLDEDDRRHLVVALRKLHGDGPVCGEDRAPAQRRGPGGLSAGR